MGCVQARPSSNSMTNSSLSSPPQGLDKLKQQSGYVPRHRGEAGAFVSHRRSTSQRYASLQENQGRCVAPHRPQPQNLSDDLVGGSGGGGVEGKLGAIGSSGSTVGDVKRSDGSGDDELVVDGWPKWLIDNVPKHVLKGLVPRSADSYDKIDKVGQGTYSNVYKARDRETGKLVALKKVRFDTSEPESIKFMAREIMILRELDHPNVVKLQGLATSRMHFSLYLVFDFMHSDLQRVIMRPEGRLSEPQVKCYMHQLLSGLQHCHDKGILHRDIKGSNLLIDKTGMLKIADFGLANYYKPRDHRRPLTNRVVTLWYRAPELLLGTTDYGVGIDLWSAGCLLAEMFAGHPIMPGRTEVEQLHKIFKLCGTPPEEYWKKMKLRTTFRPWQSYKCSLAETFEEFPSSSISLLSSLLALDPTSRGSACSALQREFFYTSPLACDLTGLPVIYKEEDDDEMIQPSELRIRRRSKSKRRLNAQRESRKKDLIARNLTRDAESTKNEQDKSAETINRVQEPGSGTSSNSSGRKTTQPDRNLATSPPRVVIISPDFANADEKKHLVPPLPVTKARMMQYRKESDGVYALSQVRRSASMREFRKLNQTKHLARYAVED